MGGSRGWGPPAGAQQCPDLCPHGSQVEATEPQDVVVYDQSTRDASVLAADSFLSILLSKLDGCFDSVAILTGELRTDPREGTGGHHYKLGCAGWRRLGRQGSGSISALFSKPRDQRLQGQCWEGRLLSNPGVL